MSGVKRVLILGGVAVLTVGAGAGVAMLVQARQAAASRGGPDPSRTEGDPPGPAPVDPPQKAPADPAHPDEAAPPPKTRPRFTVPPPEQLSRLEILAAMKRVKPRAQACFARYRQPGLLQVRLTIAPTGRVTSARAEGALAGSETARCVEGAARTASFRSSRRAPAAVTWPFLLR